MSKRALGCVAGILVLASLVYLVWPRRDGLQRKEPGAAKETKVSARRRGPGGAGLSLARRLASTTRTLVSGTVREVASRAVLPGVKIAFRAASAEVMVTTAADGSYRVGLPPDRYDIAIDAELHVATRPIPAAWVPEGSPVAGLDFVLHRAGTVAGRVLGQKKRPVPGARVTVHEARGAEHFTLPQSAALSDAEGRFTLAVPPGEVVLRVDAQTLGMSLTRPFYVGAGSHLSGLELAPEVGVSLSGKIEGPGAVSSKRAELVLRDELGSRRLPCDEHGAFAAAGLSPGPKQLQAWAPGFAPSGVMALEVRPGMPARAVLRLSPSKAVAGRVLSPDGLPVANARVSARAGMAGRSLAQLVPAAEARTDGSGVFQLSDLPNLPLIVTAVAPGGARVSRSGVPPGSYNITLRLEVSGSVVGQVTDGQRGQPVRDFVIEITPTGGALDLTSPPALLRVVSGSGELDLDGLIPGTYRLVFGAPGYGATVKTDVAIIAGSAARVDVNLDEAGTIAGRVVDAAGGGIGGVEVDVDAGRLGLPVVTDTGGAFLLRDVARGSRAVTARRAGYEPRTERDVAVFAGSTAQVQLELRPAGQ